MNDMKQILYSLQRFQMLALYGNSAAERTISQPEPESGSTKTLR